MEYLQKHKRLFFFAENNMIEFFYDFLNGNVKNFLNHPAKGML